MEKQFGHIYLQTKQFYAKLFQTFVQSSFCLLLSESFIFEQYIRKHLYALYINMDPSASNMRKFLYVNISNTTTLFYMNFFILVSNIEKYYKEKYGKFILRRIQQWKTLGEKYFVQYGPTFPLKYVQQRINLCLALKFWALEGTAQGPLNGP